MEVSGKWIRLWFLSYKDSYVKMSMTKDAEYVGGMYKRSWESKYTWFGVCATIRGKESKKRIVSDKII